MTESFLFQALQASRWLDIPAVFTNSFLKVLLAPAEIDTINRAFYLLLRSLRFVSGVFADEVPANRFAPFDTLVGTVIIYGFAVLCALYFHPVMVSRNCRVSLVI